MTEKWHRRDRKLQKRRYGMRVSGRGLVSVLLPLIGQRARRARGE